MKSEHDATFHLRLPASLRQHLDDAARASGSDLSTVARRALRAGLRVLGSSPDDSDPPHPGGAPAGVPSLPAAA